MMLDDIVSRGRGGPPGQFHDNANGGQNGTVQEIMIPAGKAGLVIGKGGETIKQLQVCVGNRPNKALVPTFSSILKTASDRHLHCRSGLG
jgi:hypothetical protein